MPNFTFRKHINKQIVFLNLDMILRNSAPEELARLNLTIKYIAMKIETNANSIFIPPSSSDLELRIMIVKD